MNLQPSPNISYWIVKLTWLVSWKENRYWSITNLKLQITKNLINYTHPQDFVAHDQDMHELPPNWIINYIYPKWSLKELYIQTHTYYDTDIQPK